MKSLFLLLLFVLSTAAMQAQERGTLSGRVVDEEGKPIIGAVIRLFPAGSGSGVSKAPEGRFLISGIPAGDYTLEIICIGYRKVTRMINIAGGDTNDQGMVDLGDAQELLCKRIVHVVEWPFMTPTVGTIRIIQGRDLW